MKVLNFPEDQFKEVKLWPECVSRVLDNNFRRGLKPFLNLYVRNLYTRWVSLTAKYKLVYRYMTRLVWILLLKQDEIRNIGNAFSPVLIRRSFWCTLSQLFHKLKPVFNMFWTRMIIVLLLCCPCFSMIETPDKEFIHLPYPFLESHNSHQLKIFTSERHFG